MKTAKRWLLFLPLLLCLFAFASCDVEKMGSLPELSKPYIGVYACERLTLGSEDMLEKFEKIELELEYDGTFCLTYIDAGGVEGEYTGTYTISPDAGTITLSMKAGLRASPRTFRFENGSILIDANVLGKLLYAEFRLP